MPTRHPISRECVKVLSADGRLIHVNAVGVGLLELDSRNALDGRIYADLWPDESRLRVARAIYDAAHGDITVLEGYCPTFAGTPRWWETTFYPETVLGGTDVVIGVSRDISLHRSDLLATRIARERSASLAAGVADGVPSFHGHDRAAPWKSKNRRR